nr:MAG TPA: Head Tail Connector Protein [Caudoviricetes sp.]
MAYLTFPEYQKFGYQEVTEDDFKRLVVRASDVIDIRTRNFYRFHDLESDVEFRKNQFKKAIALQIERMAILGAVSTAEIDSPTNWSLDGVSVTNGSSGASGDNTTSIVSNDALELLSMTGLLYRGTC